MRRTFFAVASSETQTDKGRFTMDDCEPLLDRKAAAKYIGVVPGTLAVWDCTKRYDLKPQKAGYRVRYRKADLDNFLARFLRP